MQFDVRHATNQPLDLAESRLLRDGVAGAGRKFIMKLVEAIARILDRIIAAVGLDEALRELKDILSLRSVMPNAVILSVFQPTNRYQALWTGLSFQGVQPTKTKFPRFPSTART